MDTILKADIFFIVTTVVVSIVGLLIALVLIYLIRILSDVKKLSRKVRQEGEALVEDIDDLRENIKRNTIKLSDILSFGFLRKKAVRKNIKKSN